VNLRTLSWCACGLFACKSGEETAPTKTIASHSAGSEASTIFGEIVTRLEQYKMENGGYPPSIGESTLHPARPTEAKQSLLPLPPSWEAVRLRFSDPAEVYCGYTWVTGLPGSGANVGPQGTSFGFTPPPMSWYYVLARCDLDGNGAVDSYYFTSSVDPTVRARDEGR